MYFLSMFYSENYTDLALSNTPKTVSNPRLLDTLFLLDVIVVSTTTLDRKLLVIKLTQIDTN